MVPQDLEEPRSEGAPQVEAVERVERLHEGILKGVTSILQIAQHAGGETKPRRFVGPDKRLVEPSVAGLALAYQLPLQLRLQSSSFL